MFVEMMRRVFIERLGWGEIFSLVTNKELVQLDIRTLYQDRQISISIK